MRAQARRQVPAVADGGAHRPTHSPTETAEPGALWRALALGQTGAASAAAPRTPPGERSGAPALATPPPAEQPAPPMGEDGVEQSPGPPPGQAGAGAGAAAGGAAGAVKSFKLTFGNWSEYRFQIDFYLELAPGFSRKDVLIGQDLMGEIAVNGTPVLSAPTWITDNRSTTTVYPWTFWWDGSVWNAAGPIGMGAAFYGWSWFGQNESAHFLDMPGYPSYMFDPFYYAGVGGKDYMEFRTYVLDASQQTKLRELTWGIRMVCSGHSAGDICTHAYHL